jgi:hypothetical protein
MSVDTQHTPIYNLRWREEGEYGGTYMGSRNLVVARSTSVHTHPTRSGSVSAQKVLNRARLGSTLGAEAR